MQTTEIEPRVQAAETEDAIVGLFEHTPEEESAPEGEARELDSGVVLNAWNALNAEQRHFLLRSILSDHEQFNALTAKQLEDYRTRGEKAKANRMVLMRGMRKLLVGFPNEKDLALFLLHAARGSVRELGITEADRKRLGEAAGTDSAESIMEEIKTRVQGEQSQVAAFLEKRIDEIIGTGDDDAPPPGPETPEVPEEEAEAPESESPGPETISPELWKELDKLGLNYVEIPARSGETEYVFFLDPSSEHLEPELAGLFNLDQELSKPTVSKNKKDQRARDVLATSWQQARTTMQNKLQAAIQRRVQGIDGALKSKLFAVKRARMAYPSEEQARHILAKLKEQYPDDEIGVYIPGQVEDPEINFMYISKTGEISPKAIPDITRRPRYHQEIKVFPVITIAIDQERPVRMERAA